jgi:MFS transporter, DHA2 family, multidrug resistance protein
MRRLRERLARAAAGDVGGERAELSATRKWAITLAVMLVTVMQILDTSVTNVALPHMQGSLSASVEEVSWVLTSYLAANAIILPATGWLSGLLGRKRFFLLCTTLFTVSSFLSGIAPSLEWLIAMRIFQGIGGGPMVPISQAIMWEIFPLRQRGTAMAVWGIGVMMGPILGPTLGGWIADNWSWRWIFYINLPIGVLGFLMASLFIFDPPHLRRPEKVDGIGLVLMVLGFAALQFVLDRGEREDWFESGWIVSLTVLAACALCAFLVRELTTGHPILDFSVFASRNFAIGAAVIGMTAFGLYSSMLLLALYTQKLLAYDAWSSGMVLAPGGVGNMISLVIAGRLVARADQRFLLAAGCVLNGIGLALMSNLTLGVDYWGLAWPRFIHGLGLGFIFVPLTTLALASVPRERLGNATAAFNVVRNIGGSVGVALATTMLSRRSQSHQATLVGHVDVWSAATAARVHDWTAHFLARGDDTFTAARRATAMLYRDTVEQAQVLAYADEFWALSMVFFAILFLLPFMRRVRAEPASATGTRAERVEPLPAVTD